MTTHGLISDVTPLAYFAAWSDFGGGYAPGGYYKDPFGIVHLVGLCEAFANAPSNIATLPVGFRPASAELYAVLANNVLGRVDVFNNGVITLNVGNGSFVQLSGITFLAAA